jgi:hypothetical protein
MPIATRRNVTNSWATPDFDIKDPVLYTPLWRPDMVARGGAMVNGTGTLSVSPLVLAIGANTVSVTGLGTFIVNIPEGGTVASGTTTVTGSPVTVSAGIATTITTTGSTGNITVTPSNIIRSKDKNNHACTVTEAVWGSQGRTFDGTNDIINLSAAITQLNLSAGTLLMWVWSSSATAGVMFGTGEGGADTGDYSQIILCGANVTGDYADETVLYSIISATAEKLRMVLRLGTGTYNDGVKRHIALRCDGVDNAIFVNGIKQSITFGIGNATTSGWFLNPATNNEAHIGKRTFSGSPVYFTGNIGEVMVFSRGLTNQSIQNLYLATKWRYK